MVDMNLSTSVSSVIKTSGADLLLPESSCTRWACAAGPPRSLHLVKHLEQGIDALQLRLCPQVQGVISLLSGLYPTQK